MIEAVDDLGLVTIAEAAALLGITTRSAWAAARAGTLAARQLGAGSGASVWITTRDDVARYRAEHSDGRRRSRRAALADRAARLNAMHAGT